MIIRSVNEKIVAALLKYQKDYRIELSRKLVGAFNGSYALLLTNILRKTYAYYIYLSFITGASWD